MEEAVFCRSAAAAFAAGGTWMLPRGDLIGHRNPFVLPDKEAAGGVEVCDQRQSDRPPILSPTERWCLDRMIIRFTGYIRRDTALEAGDADMVFSAPVVTPDGFWCWWDRTTTSCIR